MKFEYTDCNDVFCGSELNLKQYKNLLKTIYDENPNETIFLRELLVLFADLFGKDTDWCNSLSFEQLFLLLVQLRINTFGSDCQLVLTTKESEDKTIKKNIFLNLEKTKEDVIAFIKLMQKDSAFVHENTESIFLLPSYKRMMDCSLLTSHLSFLSECRIKKESDSIYCIKINNNNDASDIIDRLSPKILSHAISFAQSYIIELSRVNFLSHYIKDEGQHLTFSPSVKTLIWYTKLFFSENISTFYNNIFYLCKLGNINLQYLENDCTPGEYMFFVNQLLESQKPEVPADLADDNAVDNFANEYN